jgi:penicillin-binding protein 1C
VWTNRRRAINALALLAALAALMVWADWRFPPPLERANEGRAQLVLDHLGRPLRAFPDSRGVWRYPVAVGQVSPNYLRALIAYEDRHFDQHFGVNPVALARAVWLWMRHGRVISGGSTLSMQVARLIEPIPRTALGKLQQIARAVQIERRLSKAEVLAIYLNRAPFGGTIEGLETAARAYLGRSSGELSDAEAALLAVIPQSPSRLRPDRWPARAKAARDKVLKRVAALDHWSPSRLDAALAEPVASLSLREPVHAALLAERLIRDDPRAVIQTTIDLDLQRALERRVAAFAQQLPARASVAVLVVDTASMAALAYVGSAQYGDAERFGHVDMLRAVRSPGSTLKPLLYGLAIEDGLIHSGSLLMDVPTDFGGYRPLNFEGGFRGPVSASDALAASLNLPAVDLLERVSPERFSARLAHAGLKLSLAPGARPNLSLILGGVGVRLDALVAAHAALARGGRMTPVRFQPTDAMPVRQLLDPGAAYVVQQMLLAAPRPGINRQALVADSAALAWKTGTSHGYRDALALGTNASISIGIWVGRPDGTPSPGAFGAATALPLLFEIGQSITRTRPQSARARPANVHDERICWPLGRRASETAVGACARSLSAWSVAGQVPPTFPDRDAPLGDINPRRVMVDAAGRQIRSDCGVGRTVTVAQWPRLAGPWLSPKERRDSALPRWSRACWAQPATDSERPFRIARLYDGMTIAGAPNRQHVQIRLAADRGEAERLWFDNERFVGATRGTGDLLHRFDRGGRHRLVALGPDGSFAEVSVMVSL